MKILREISNLYIRKESWLAFVTVNTSNLDLSLRACLCACVHVWRKIGGCLDAVNW